MFFFLFTFFCHNFNLKSFQMNTKPSTHKPNGSVSGDDSNPDTEPPSADDEGSKDGDNDDDEGPDVEVQGEAKKSNKEGVKQRRVQRTWKHFYEEVRIDSLKMNAQCQVSQCSHRKVSAPRKKEQ